MAVTTPNYLDEQAREHRFDGANADYRHASASAVSWGAIIAGAAAAASLSLILLILGTGLGLSSVSPWDQRGVDAGLVKAHKRAPVTLASGEVVDYGMVGDIDGVDGSVITRLLDTGFLPVVSPLSCDAAGQLLNINADTVASAIGAALGAEKLLLCTGAPGILQNVEDPTSVISYTDLAGLQRLRNEKRIVDGMLPKAKAIENAITGGVKRVHVISYKSPDAILAEVFTNEGTGTLVVADVQKLAPAELAAGGPASA